MRRELEVICWSRRLAVGPVTGTPLEGRVYWPEPADLAQHFGREIEGEAGFMIPAFLFVTQKQIAAARKAAVKLVRERHREA